MGDIILNGIKYAGGGGGGASSLSQLTDVNVTSPSDGQFLTYDGVAQEWKNTTITDEGHVYSTSEKVVGKWINNKPVYEITIDFGSLPNNSTKSVSIGASNIENIIKIYGIGIASTGASIPLPYSDDYYVTGNVLLDANASSGEIRMIARSDKSVFYGYVTIQYTKTTDA